MIKVIGSAHHSFAFPGKLPVAYAYYADVARVLSYLPHICLVRAFGPDRFRLLFSSTELGLYHVRIFADVQTTLEPGWVVRVRALEGLPPVGAEAGVHSSTAQGVFESRSVFYADGDQTRIDYSLRLVASLPTPHALRFMPGVVMDRITRGITRMRMREVVEGFIERSTDAFPYWLDEMRNHTSLPAAGNPDASPEPMPTCPEELV
jgi:hypothetical protein